MGIGTLIILIAAILVATIAAGVFFDVAGLLQSKSSSTSDDVSRQLDGQLEIVSVSGTVTNERVDTVNVTVALSSSSGTVDLRAVTIQWVGTDSETLVWSGSDESGPTFDVTTYGNEDPVLTRDTDRATFTIDPDSFGSALTEGDTVRVTVVTRSEVTYRLVVPRSLSNRSVVSL